ncbi:MULTISPECIES: hypothetical protein [Bacteria]|uniref:hypothetical protein n=1 Tax=Bacteria TaxID=2 RepID=UPI003C7C3894
MTTTTDYFAWKAREVFQAAGGDPALAGPLGEWARTAKGRADASGVLVAQDGAILGETVRIGRSPQVTASHVKTETARRWGLTVTEVGLAVGQVSRAYGQPVIHLTVADLTMGAGPR